MSEQLACGRCAIQPDRLATSSRCDGDSRSLYEKSAVDRTFVHSDYTGQQNLTFFLAHEEKYLILIELLKLNSNV